MTSTIIDDVVQTQPFFTIFPGEDVCSCGDCSWGTSVKPCKSTDWNYANKSCCGSLCTTQPLCTIPDPFICDIAGTSVDGENLGFKQFTNGNGDRVSTNVVQCKYNIDDFTTVDDVLGYTEKYNPKQNFNDPNTSQIMASFCQMTSTDCPVDQTTGKKIKICSNFVSNAAATTSNTTANQLCREYTAQNPSSSNAAQASYCSNVQNQDNKDCGCINRQSNSTYKELAQLIGAGIPDTCWYVPCKAESGTTLVPSNTSANCKTDPKTGNTVCGCPTGVCQVVIQNIAKSGGTINENVQNSLTCNFNPPSPTPGPNPTPNPEPGPQPDPDNGGNFFSNNKALIIFIVVVLVAVILGSIFFNARKKKKALLVQRQN